MNNTSFNPNFTARFVSIGKTKADLKPSTLKIIAKQQAIEDMKEEFTTIHLLNDTTVTLMM